ncbi:MAG: Tail Collar domain protein [Parcubacteria group bacterium GW2011_GWA2_49_9]|nr:MAG: Tail Collar domain protein [Parcubacteria group bacterium GW2011_GWA2_49_9]
MDTSTPTGSANPTQGDDRIRELKLAIVEREGQDHYWPASGTTYDNDDCGFHKKVTLLVQTTITQKADAGILYSKDVAAKAELHYKDEDGNEIQLTSVGALNGGSPFVTGDLLLSSVTTAHTGWTNVTATYASKHIRVGDTVLGTGGSATLAGTTGSHTLSIAEMPAHTHDVSVYGGFSAGSTPGSGATHIC